MTRPAGPSTRLHELLTVRRPPADLCGRLMDRHASRLRGGFSWGFAPLIAPLIAHAKESARWFHFGSTPALPHPAFGRRKMLIRDFESEINTTGCGGELWFLPFCVPRVDLHSDTRYPHGRGHFPCGYVVTQGESTREYAFDPALPLLLPKKMLIRDFRFEINTTGRRTVPQIVDSASSVEIQQT